MAFIDGKGGYQIIDLKVLNRHEKVDLSTIGTLTGIHDYIDMYYTNDKPYMFVGVEGINSFFVSLVKQSDGSFQGVVGSTLLTIGINDSITMTDLADSTDLKEYLPLTGGTLSGSLYFRSADGTNNASLTTQGDGFELYYQTFAHKFHIWGKGGGASYVKKLALEPSVSGETEVTATFPNKNGTVAYLDDIASSVRANVSQDSLLAINEKVQEEANLKSISTISLEGETIKSDFDPVKYVAENKVSDDGDVADNVLINRKVYHLFRLWRHSVSVADAVADIVANVKDAVTDGDGLKSLMTGDGYVSARVYVESEDGTTSYGNVTCVKYSTTQLTIYYYAGSTTKNIVVDLTSSVSDSVTNV